MVPGLTRQPSVRFSAAGPLIYALQPGVENFRLVGRLEPAESSGEAEQDRRGRDGACRSDVLDCLYAAVDLVDVDRNVLVVEPDLVLQEGKRYGFAESD